MKKFRLWLAALLTAALSAFLFAACSTGVSLDKTELTLQVGQSETLTANAPEDALLSWSSSDEAIATVDGGTVTAVAEGSATITVRATVGDSAYTAQCSVTVTPADNVTVIFVADGTTVDTVEVVYGGSIAQEDIPAVPEKSGYVGTWDKNADDLTNLTADTTVTAQYAQLFDYTVTVYTQQSDLTYTAGEPQTLSAAEGTTVTAEPDEAEEGYFLDTEKSVLSATLEEGTELKIYYSLEYDTVYVRRADSSSAEYRVYASGNVATTEGEIVDDFSQFALTADSDGHYYFWNIGGVIVRRALEKADFSSAGNESVISESYSTHSLLNTGITYQSATLNEDGTVTFNPTPEWATGVTPGYVYFTGSSNTFYAKVTVTHAEQRGDTSVGFVLTDAQNPDKNVQFYIEGYGSDRTLFQNNSWGWDNSMNRTAYSDTKAAFNSNSNVIEFAMANGYYYFWLNGNFFYSDTVSSLTGAGQVAGLFDDTTTFNLGICQWRKDKCSVTFSEMKFCYGSEAAEKVESMMFDISFANDTVNVDLSDESTLQLSIVSNWGTTVDLSGVSYSTEDTDVVTVDASTGKLTVVGAGTATVKATLVYQEETYTAECSVVVAERTVTFTADESPVKVIKVINGGNVSAEDIPEVPLKDGFVGKWDKTAEQLVGITEDTVVTAQYFDNQYTVNYYKQNAKTGEYEMYDSQTTLTSETEITIDPSAPANYTINAEKSKLSGTIVDKQLTLEVYFDLVVDAVTVSIDLDGTPKTYTAYYALGLYDGETEVSDYSPFAKAEGYVWNINGTFVLMSLDKAYFSSLLEDVTIVRNVASTTISTVEGDTEKVTIHEDGSIDAVSGGWTGAWAYMTGSGTSFYAQTVIRSRRFMDGGAVDGDIAAGFTVRGSDGSSIQFYISPEFNSIRANYGHRWEGNDGIFGNAGDGIGTWIIDSRAGLNIPKDNFMNGEGAVIGLSYNAETETFTIYYDGAQIFTATLAQLQFGTGTVSMGTGWSVGLASWNDHMAYFEDYFVVFGQATQTTAPVTE